MKSINTISVPSPSRLPATAVRDMALSMKRIPGRHRSYPACRHHQEFPKITQNTHANSKDAANKTSHRVKPYTHTGSSPSPSPQQTVATGKRMVKLQKMPERSTSPSPPTVPPTGSRLDAVRASISPSSRSSTKKGRSSSPSRPRTPHHSGQSPARRQRAH